MRIHYVTPGYHPDVGGVETHVRQLAHFAARRGHAVTVHTRGARTEAATDGAVSVRRYRPRASLGYYAVWFTPRVEDADLVHLHGYGFLPNDRAARRAGDRPLFYTLDHGLKQPRGGTLGSVKWSVYETVWARGTFRRCTRILPLSRADVPPLVHMGIPLSRIEVSPVGLPEASFDDRGGRPPAGVEAEPFFLYLGRIHPDKAIGDLLRALAHAGRDAKAVVAGSDGEERARLGRLATQIGVADRVRFPGHVSEDEKRWLLDRCTALVLPSKYEAQGIAILEAWARGKPVIASAVGGVPFVVKDEETGLLYRQGNVDALARRMRRLIEDEALGPTLGQAGLAVARARYRHEVISSRVLDMYAEAATSRRTG